MPKAFGMEGPVMSASRTAALHLGGEQASDKGFADATLAAHNADYLLDAGTLVKCLAEGLRAALAAALAAG